MERTNRLIARGARWIALLRLVRGLVVALSLATALLVAGRGAAVLTSFEAPWNIVWAWALGAAALGAVLWTWFTRPGRLTVARQLDEGAGLRESLSTALTVQGGDDPWSQATIQHAERLAGGVVVRQAIPASMPKLWPAPLVCVGLFFLVGLINPIDVFGWGEERKADAQQVQDLQAAKQTLVETNEAVKQAEALLAEHGETSKPEEPDAPAAEPRTPEQVRVEAARKLTTASNKLDQLRGDQMKKLDALGQKLQRLKMPDNSPAELDTLLKSMQKGDFAQAQEALKQLEQLMQKAGELSPEQQEALKDALKNLAEQLEQLAKQQDALEQALADAGLDRQLASDLEALKQALQNSQNLSQAQRDALRKMAENQKLANQQCQNMAQACNSMSQCAGGQNMGQLSNAMQGMAGQLSELEMMQMSMQDMQAQLAQMQKLMAQAGTCRNPGNSAFGNLAGKGTANNTDPDGVDMSQFTAQPDKVATMNRGGPVIGSMLVEAGQVRGESVQQFTEAVQAGASEASQAIEEMTVPREYQEAVKGYFEELNGTVREAGDAETESPDDPGAKPA